MAKKIGNKKRKKLDRLSGLIYSSNNPMKVRAGFFKSFDGKAMYRNVHKIRDHRYFEGIVSLKKDKNYEGMYDFSCPRTGLEKSVSWSFGVLESNVDGLLFLIEKEQLITHGLLCGDYDGCILSLDEIDSRFGISTWTVTLRGSVLRLMENHEAYSSFVADIESKSGKNVFFYTIARHISARYEDNGSYYSSIRSLRDQITRSVHGERMEFLLYKLAPVDHLQKYNYGDIVNFEKNASVVDLFHAVVDYCSYKYINGSEFTNDTLEYLSSLSSKLEYAPLSRIAAMSGCECSWSFNKCDFDFIDLYTRGDYVGVRQAFEAEPDKFESFQHFEIISKSLTRASSFCYEGMKGKILKSMVSLLLRDEGYDKALSYLYCLCHSFSPLRWFKELYLFVENETKSLSSINHDKLKKLSIISSPLNSPRMLGLLSDKVSMDYLGLCRKVVDDSISLKMWLHKDDLAGEEMVCLGGIEDNRLNKYIAKAYIAKGDYDKAIPLLEVLAGKNDRLIVYETSKLLVESYIEAGQYLDALGEFVLKCVNNANLIRSYDTEKICQVARDSAAKSKSICVSIALSLHSRYVNSDYDPALRFSFNKFLQNNKIVKPLDGISVYEKYDQELVEYFLGYVCIPDIMKLYLGFKSTKEIEMCRIEVCKYLFQGGISKDAMLREIKERTKKVVISDAVRQVENRKIYSDTSVFYSDSGLSKFCQLYSKFNDLRKNDYSSFEDEKSLQELVGIFDEKGILDHAYTVHIVDVPLNEKNSFFMTLLGRIRDEFCYGDKGLNNYLSTRIRHGHLPTTLRRCVVSENLVTKRISESSSFKPNTYWTSRIPGVDEKITKKVDKLFSEFSSAFERTIEEINDKWIQIITLDQQISSLASQKGKSEALFNYSTSNLESYVVQNRIPINAEYAEFIKRIIQWLWARTDYNLNNVKQKISVEAKQELYNLITQLHKEISVISLGSEFLNEFSDAIGRAKTLLNVNIENVISWFQRANDSLVDSFEIDTAIEIAKRSANVEVFLVKNNEVFLDGNTLSNFVDLFFIFFENALSKSGLESDSLNLEIRIENEGDSFNMRLVNRCSAVGDLEAANRSLDIYRGYCSGGNVSPGNVQCEGGTGFIKASNILKNGLGLDGCIDFGYQDNTSFEVHIQVKNFGRVVKNENTISRG